MHVKHALYKSFENEEFVALLKILIASRRLHYQIKRSLKTKFARARARALFLSAFLMRDKYK